MIINESLGAWSQLFVLLAAMTYLVAFVAFAWDMASHSKPLRRAPAPTAEQQEPVGAGAAFRKAATVSGTTLEAGIPGPGWAPVNAAAGTGPPPGRWWPTTSPTPPCATPEPAARRPGRP